jgi:hypothetical protein
LPSDLSVEASAKTEARWRAVCPPKRTAVGRTLFEIVNDSNVTLLVMQDAPGPATQTQPRQEKDYLQVPHNTTQSPSKSA